MVADSAEGSDDHSSVDHSPGDAASDTRSGEDGGPTAVSAPASTSDSEAPDAPSAPVSLQSLASKYEESQHETYLRRLNEAVADAANRNIALTGRYGSGKSSVLDEFEHTHKKTRRLAISTLGPDAQGVTTTNRIQKELLKQFVYSASPSTLRHSRFSRATSLPRWRTIWESIAGVLTVGLTLALLGWLPQVAGTSDGDPWYAQAVAWLLLVGLVSTVVTVVRFITHDRFVLSDVSAAGATVKLSAKNMTYFDEYLDEIVNYFDEEDVDIVIFEDLDRFDDPRIFEALRELNTLLNSTPSRSSSSTPLQFVYAVRDSLFERLGSDVDPRAADTGGVTRDPSADADAAATETVRANRTKFFDIVIPMVPFISHRNAQDLLSDLLAEAHITEVERNLVDLVAQHATDMRLLRNMRNEYLVFAERLLGGEKQAPELSPSRLFALVAYKNFHLEDFEQISRRRSDLDRLYEYRRELVRSCVSNLERQKRDLQQGRTKVVSMKAAAERMGARLVSLTNVAVQASSYSGSRQVGLKVGESNFSTDQASGYDFWAAVAVNPEITIRATQGPGYGWQNLATLTNSDVSDFFAEANEAGSWLELDEAKSRERIARLEQEVAFLRGADFKQLVASSYQLATDAHGNVATRAHTGTGDGAESPRIEQTFFQITKATLKSDLAVELVTRGYIDRNFSLYAAQFYGDFTGIDVATFLVQSANTNTMDIDYRFTSDGAIENLLDAAGEDFTRTEAAYNLDILDHLLATNDTRAGNVVTNVITRFDSSAQEFLTAYWSTGTQRRRLASWLSAGGWARVFPYLVGDETIPDDARTSLVDAALLAANPRHGYTLEESVAMFVSKNCRDMSAFTRPQQQARLVTLVGLLKQAGVALPQLAPVHETLRTQLVANNVYTLTADNLRAALDITGSISLDHVLKNENVYRRCVANPGTYLAAVTDDDLTDHTVEDAATLAALLPVLDEHWEPEHVAQLIAATSPDATLDTLRDIPVSTWPALADACRFAATLANVEAYRGQVGAIDEHLATLLLAARDIDAGNGAPEGVDISAAALALLNATPAIADPAARIRLVRSIGVTSVDVSGINAEEGPLLALALEAGLVADDAASFARFAPAGWAALGPAITASEHFEEFITPELVDGVVAPLLGDAARADRVGDQIVSNLAAYVPTDDAAALRAAGSYALSHRVNLPADQIQRIAGVGAESRGTTMRLLAQTDLPADQVVAVLAALGSPYDNLSTRAEAQFEVPEDDTVRAVLDKLEQAGMCTVTKKVLKPALVVKLT